MSPISIAVVEDDPAARARFSAAVEAASDLVLAGSFANGKDALAWLENHTPDVLLTDLGLPDIPGLAVITYCARRHPACDIMVITMYEDEAHVVRCLEAGASGYLLKDSLHDEIARHIRDLRAGGAPMTPVIARQVLKRFRANGPAPHAVPDDTAATALTVRELFILNRVAQGFRYGEIAELEQISINTVHTHVKNIYSKLAVHSRSEAVYEAMQMGLIEKGLPRH